MSRSGYAGCSICKAFGYCSIEAAGCFHVVCNDCLDNWGLPCCPLCHIFSPSRRKISPRPPDKDRVERGIKFKDPEMREDELYKHKACTKGLGPRENRDLEFRRRVYNLNLWVKFLPPQVNDRSRPDYFVRLIPWLKRELSVLLKGTTYLYFFVPHVLNIIKLHDIHSKEFLAHMRRFLEHKAEHFVHELSSFSNSVLDMHSFDQLVAYSPRPEKKWVPYASSQFLSECPQCFPPGSSEWYPEFSVLNATCLVPLKGCGPVWWKFGWFPPEHWLDNL